MLSSIGSRSPTLRSPLGLGRKQTLESFGIETALDITYGALANVPGLGPKTQQKLFDRRRSLERRFVFDATKPIDPQAIRKVEADHITEMKRSWSRAWLSYAE